MPNFPIIDTHLHVWDQTRLKYSAFEGSPLFGHPYHVEDYQRDSGTLQIEAMVFLECYADFGQYLEEIAFVEEEQKRDPRLKAIIPMAPLELGAKVEPMLRQMLGEGRTADAAAASGDDDDVIHFHPICFAPNRSCGAGPTSFPVMPGLDPGIHLLSRKMDCRVKPGNDENEALTNPAPAAPDIRGFP